VPHVFTPADLAHAAPNAIAAAPGVAWAPAVRLLLAPFLIGAASVIARRWGPEAGGWFAALPLTSGPAVLVLALEHGARFAAEACVGILLAIVALAAYVLVYAWSSRRAGWVVSAALACPAYLAAAWPLVGLRSSLTLAFAIACAAVAVTCRIMPHDRRVPVASRLPVWDIPLRMVLAAALVWTLARVAGVAGPRASGLLAPFPVAVTILSTFTQHHDGAAAARRFLRSLLPGLISFAVFFLIAGVLLRGTGVALSFLAATSGALAAHMAAWRAAGGSRPPLILPIRESE
jgi:hypothetical protein